MSKLSACISPTPPSWETIDFCAWKGLTCVNTGRVTYISLPSRSLTGTLPADLNSLSELRTLALQRNSLSGPLPNLAKLSHLEQVSLDGKNFTSQSSLPPDIFSGLTNLVTFSISDNLDLSAWSLPNDLAQSSSLQSFKANNANIIRSIPDIFYSFHDLQNLLLSHNNLTGPLPATFGGSNIINLWLNSQSQGLTCTLDVISLMYQVNQVWLHSNSFTGLIPDLSKCVNIFDLQLRNNLLNGLVPNSLTSLPQLANITLQENKLEGPFPLFQTNVKFRISGNSFCLPTFGNCDPQVTALLEIAGALGYPKLAWKSNDACSNWICITCDSSRNVTGVNFAKQKFSGTILPSQRR